MSGILRVFGKDVRRLWPFVVAVGGFQALLAALIISLFYGNVAADSLDGIWYICNFFALPISWVVTFAMAVLDNSPANETAYWFTRPFTAGTIFGGKLLFAIVCFHLPLFVSDCVLLKSIGLPLDWPNLLLRQLPQAALLVMPTWALASASKSFPRFCLLAVPVVLACWIFNRWRWYVGGNDPLVTASDVPILLTVPLVLLPIVGWQLSRQARFMAVGATVLIILLICGVLLKTQLWLGYMVISDGAPTIEGPWRQMRMQYDPMGKASGLAMDPSGTGLWDMFGNGFCVPVKTSEIPEGIQLYAHGEARFSVKPEPMHVFLRGSKNTELCFYYMHPVLKRKKLDIRADLDVVARNAKPTYQATFRREGVATIPDIGVCRFQIGRSTVVSSLSCWTGPVVRNSVMRAAETFGGMDMGDITMGDQSALGCDHLAAGFVPLRFAGRLNSDAREMHVRFTRRFPIGHLRREFSVDGFTYLGKP